MMNSLPGSKSKAEITSAGKYLLEVKDLTKKYNTHTILDSIAFNMVVGERMALMGPSGSGKSTLLNCLGGLDRADTGTIHLEGKDLLSMKSEALAQVRRKQVAHIFQFFHLLPTLSARENIEFPLQLLGWSRSRRRDRVDSLLDAVGISHRAEAPPSELSGGEMQRTAIARALAPEPSLILADEPTGNLDSKTGERILDLLEKLCGESSITLLLVTHDPATTRICKRILHLLDGKIQEEIKA